MPFDIAAQIEKWRTQLLDTGKRNRLISFKAGRTGGINLVHPDPGDLWDRLVTKNAALTFARKCDLIDLPPDPEETDPGGELTLFDPAGAPEQQTGQNVLERCRRSPRLRDNHLLTDLRDSPLARRLTRLALNSREALTEQGVAILYVAFGFLRWFESDTSEVEIRSPLLLVPVRLDRDSVEAPWKLQGEDEDILPNHSLVQRLAKDFRLRLPLPEDEPAGADDPNWRTRYFGEVERCVRDLRRWEVLDEVALGTFSIQKLAMWEDLGRNRDRIMAHDLCRAVACDPTVSLRSPPDLPRANELDRKTDPATTFHILNADSSQHEAIEAAKRGASFVLDGPPGTGKSQTIANIIADCLANGKTVLFVSEKAAALEVVQRRLKDTRLDDFCLACHSHKANKREVVEELGRCLGLKLETFRDASDDLQRLGEARRQLNEYVRELHAPRPPLGMTVYQVHGELTRLSRLASKSRCPIPEILTRDAPYLRRVVDLLARLPDCRSVIEAPDRHPWRGCRATVFSLTLRDDVRHHFGRLVSCLGGIADATTVIHRVGFCVAQPTQTQWRGAVETSRVVLTCPPVPPAWFTGDPRPIADAVVQIDRLSQEYRRARADLPEFAPDLLRVADADALAAMGTFPNTSRLLLRPANTVRTLLRRLPCLNSALRELCQRATAIDLATQRVAELLRTPLPSLPVRKIHLIAELADLSARLGPVPRTWWDDGRRKELQGVIARCQEEVRKAQESRAELAARLAPRAFAYECSRLAARASRFRSFIARLSPSWWWSLKAKVTALYIVEPPKPAALLDDMRKLAAYHRRIDYCQQIREQYAADLLEDGDGEPDWDRTLKAVRSVDRLAQLTKNSPSLRAALTTMDGIDRPSLAAAGHELATRCAALSQELEATRQEYDLAEVTDEASGQVRLAARALAAWLEAQVGAVGRQAPLLEQVSGLLAEGRDVSVEALPARLRTLAELGKLRTALSAQCNRGLPGQPRVAEDHDWSVLRGGRRGCTPSPRLVAGATTPSGNQGSYDPGNAGPVGRRSAPERRGLRERLRGIVAVLGRAVRPDSGGFDRDHGREYALG